MSLQQFCVRWNNHLKIFQSALPKYFQNQKFLDCTLVVEGQHLVQCHRMVLDACSDYFSNFLKNKLFDDKNIVILLPNEIRLWQMQAILQFMYQGEVCISQEGLPSLVKCAELLQVKGLCGSDPSTIVSADNQDSDNNENNHQHHHHNNNSNNNSNNNTNKTTDRDSILNRALQNKYARENIEQNDDDDDDELKSNQLDDNSPHYNSHSTNSKMPPQSQNKQHSNKEQQSDKHGLIRVKSNLFEIYQPENQAKKQQQQQQQHQNQECNDNNSSLSGTCNNKVSEVAITSGNGTDETMANALVYNKNAMDIYVKTKETAQEVVASKQSTVRKTLPKQTQQTQQKKQVVKAVNQFEDIICAPNLLEFNMSEDEDEEVNDDTNDVDFNMKSKTNDMDSTFMESENEIISHLLDASGTSSVNDGSSGRRVRRSEALLNQAAECIRSGQTFQTVSDTFSIPISTIRFYMARKGILPRRKRGRTAIIPLPCIQNQEKGMNSYGQGDDEHELRIHNMKTHPIKSGIKKIHKTSDPPDINISRSSSPTEPQYHFSTIKLPELRPKLFD
ncbi:unnamed protein product [Diamesa serratosioi]